MRTIKLSITRYLLIAVSICVAFLAVKYALANLAYFKVDNYLTRWQQSNTVNKDALTDALSTADLMLSLHGHHPHYLNTAAKVYEWKAFSYQYDEKVTKSNLHKALGLYEQSSRLRGHWPLTWVYMANVKAKLGQLDQHFYTYLENAMKFGPYTKEVNLQVSKLLLTHWGNLPGLSYQQGLEQISRALSNRKVSAALLNYAQSVDKSRVVCTVGKLKQIQRAIKHRSCRALN